MVDDQPRSAVVYDPDLAPPPDPRADRRLLTLIAVLTVLLVAGMGLAFYERSHSSPKEFAAARAFLGDVRDRNFTAAYGRLCPTAQAKTSEAQFAAPLQRAAARGHALRSFDVMSGNTSQLVAGAGSVHVAQADVTFADGKTGVVTLLLRSAAGPMCVFDPGRDLF